MKIIRGALLLFLLTFPLSAQTYTLGDSHAQVCYVGTPLAERGATYQDLAQGLEGRGRFARLLQRLQAPREIILAFGTNDAVGFDASRLRPAFLAVVKGLRERHPGVKLTVWGPPETHAPSHLRVGPVTECLKGLASAQGIPFVDRRFLTPDMFQRDGIHLTQAGYSELRRRTRYHTEVYP